MKKIYLSGINGQGKYSIVDDEDFDELAKYSWYLDCHGYAVRKSPNMVRMHRVINQTPKGLLTDHINRKTLDNRRKNLRTVTHSENLHNTKINRRNRSGQKGISWYARYGKWEVPFMVSRKKFYLGRYDDMASAVIVRDQFLESKGII